MSFKPLGTKYSFPVDVLNLEFPDFMHRPIKNWLLETLRYVGAIEEGSIHRNTWLTSKFRDTLQIIFREVFPEDWDDAASFIFQDQDRTANFLSFVLQKFANQEDAVKLELILSRSGSGYQTIKSDKNASEYDKGAYELFHRVSPVVSEISKDALEQKDLMDAWRYCYGLRPDYDKVVISCQNFLEQFLKDTYDPNNKKPQLGKIIGDLKNSPNKLSYKGDTAVTDKETILLLIDKIPSLRGMHTAGTGRKPSKHEAEFALHTTIYFWNLHKK